MKMLILVLMASVLAGPALAQTLDSTKTCIIVYVNSKDKQTNLAPSLTNNLTMACDGSRVSPNFVGIDEKAENDSLLRSELFKSFQFMVNPSGRKDCIEFNFEKVWWARCVGK